MGRMTVRPNVVVGAFGAIVFLLTGTIIVQNWKTLTDSRDYIVTVDVRTERQDGHSGTVSSGGSQSEPFAVTRANVTHTRLRLTWSESSLTGAQHEVTLSLRAPGGTLVGRATGTGGIAGLTIDEDVVPRPASDRFTTRSGNAQAQFENDVPPHPETRGAWSALVQANQPTQPGASDVAYTLSFEFQYYVAFLKEAPPLQK